MPLNPASVCASVTTSAATSASSIVASSLTSLAVDDDEAEEKKKRRRIDDAQQNTTTSTVVRPIVICPTHDGTKGGRGRGGGLVGGGVIVNTTSSTSSIIRTLYLTQSFHTLLLLLLSAVSMATAAPLFYCHRLDAFPRRLYATKTAYDDVRSLHDNTDVRRVSWNKNQPQGDSTISALSDGGGGSGCDVQQQQQQQQLDLQHHLNASQLNDGRMLCHHSSSKQTTMTEDDGCVPGSVYLLARHGTRFNKLTNMNRMTEQLRRIQDLIKAHAAQGAMCTEDLDWLSAWKPRHTVNDDSKLSSSGWNELHEIGRRYGELFPAILRQPYAPSLYEFRYTNYTGKGDRTRQSAKAFAKGLWGDLRNVEMIENARPDWLLQFYEHCRKYLQVVGSHPVEDYEIFKTGPEMTEVIDDVNKRLGLPKRTLGFPEVYLIFENCRLEHGLHRDSPWCSVLTPVMLEVIEYHQDIKYYWEDSYGHRISYEPACTLVKDILDHLEDDTKLGRFRFAHSGTLDSLYTRIGLFQDDEPLRANNFARHRSRRRWATSRSTPMAANIVFVKYRCRRPPTVRVQTLVNEDVHHPVRIPGCPPSPMLCPLDTLTSLWRPIAHNCDIERICEGTSTPQTTTTTNDDATSATTSPHHTT